jgi:hypothetical protein
MRTQSGFVIVFALIVLLTGVSPVNADWGDWTPGGEGVCNANNEQLDVSMAPDGSGGTILAWSDKRAGSLYYYDLYAQRMDADGNELWAADGIKIADYNLYGSCEYPQVIPDGAGGAIIVYIHQGDRGLFAQRVDASGNKLWGTYGIIVFYPTSMLEGCVGFDAIPDGSGGIIIVWDWFQRLDDEHGWYDDYLNVSAQRLDANGTKIWFPGEWPGLQLAHCFESPGVNAKVAADGAGGGIFSWIDCNRDIRAAKIDVAGNVDWNSRVNLQNWALVDVDYNSPQIVADGSGGAIISWSDWETFTQGADWWWLYAQKIDSTGNQQWATDIKLTTIFPTDTDHRVVSDGAGGAIYTFGSKDPDKVNPELKWLWIQRLDTNGAKIWGVEGILVADLVTMYLKEFSAVSDGNGGVITAWSDGRILSNRDIYAQRVDANGVEKWTDGGLPICTVTGHQKFPEIIYHGNDGVIIAWEDERSDAGDIYAQRLDNCFLKISNVNVNTTFDSQTYTWDAEFTFDTNLPATSVVYYDPTMDCFPPCGYGQQQSGPEATNHTIVLTDLPASKAYCYKITAEAAGDPSGCLPEVTGSFTLDNSYNNIYGINATFLPLTCQIRVRWYTKFPSKDNTLYWRPLGGGGWNTLSAGQANCDEERLYSAKFNVAPVMYYEYKVSTKIDGVTYTTGVYQKRSGRCIGDPPKPFEPVSSMELAKPFLLAHPNPFNPQTTVSFNLPAAVEVDLKIYSANGAYVTTLASGLHTKGIHHVQWSATNESGEMVSSGIYFMRLRMGAEVLTSKLLLLK